ncbi:putative plac8 family protein [Botrytis cinerea BcDW1]|uniref:Putative plac8 family protein n=1 Tax=Botryotinia fuckeliana (strain BcDW1) TaxID=1290391 RepID=M7TJR7_BOTF1|nr:putative plac8 family protein [Botrytis cinerea BcDW1]
MAEKIIQLEPTMEQQPLAIPQDQQLQEQPPPSSYSSPNVVEHQTNDLESSGLKAFFCPCFVYGKTQHRLNKDPNLMGYSRFNNDCFIWAGAQWCGLGAIFTTLQRRQIRTEYGIGKAGEGEVKDIALSWCCHCCVLMQQEKEVIMRNQGSDVFSQGYQRTEPMAMAQTD